MKRHSAFLFALPWVLAASLSAQAPAGTRTVKLGSLEVTALLDTTMSLPTDLLKDISAQDVSTLVGGQATITTPVNAFLVRMGRHLLLVDTGGSPAMMPSMGHILERLKANGTKPEDVEAILITHFHGDHLGGLLTPGGQRAFPNAVLRMSQAESNYWLDPATEATLPPDHRPMIGIIKAAIAPYRAAGAYKPFAPGEAPFEGVKALTEAGHTPGHTVYMFSGTQPFWAVGDIVHFGAVQFQHPEATVMFDTDSAKAAKARMALWQNAAKEHAVIGAAHLAFPGMGHVKVQGTGFSWVPLP